ncbi:MAG: LPS export ABC transporter periplasmic protein LptC [Bacteroidaceae bacterium]|nr:LPS export ABC transporter periplasmic protein LptC [Bacteroidaceae bacterium]
MLRRTTHLFSITAVISVIAVMLVFQSCESKDTGDVPAIYNRQQLPVLKSKAVSTLISDSGIISYKIIAEDWFIYDQTSPTYWSFEKGLFLEKFDRSFHVEAFISCDTAYYYDVNQIWELRGRVVAKNVKGETFKTSLLYWNQRERRFHSTRYMEIDGLEQDLSGYDFSSNESMTEYIIHKSKGAFPMTETEREVPMPTTQSDSVITPRQQ